MQEIVILYHSIPFNMKLLNTQPLKIKQQIRLLILLGVWLFNSCKTPQEKAPIFFEALSPEETGVTFNNILSPSSELNIIEYLYFYNGGGVAIGDLDNDGLEDLFFTGNQVGDQLYQNLGGLKFIDVTEKSGISSQNSWSNGVTMADVNNDGLLDIYVSVVGNYKSLKGHNKLFLNKGGFIQLRSVLVI